MTTANLPVPVQPGQVPVAIAPGETSSSAIAAREKAAVEARFLVAMNRPRDFETSRRRLLDACKRTAFAEVARYAKPVGGSKVYGLSIRFAEEARVLWGNMDVSAYIVFDDDERRIYRVQGTDLETNANEGVDIIVEKFVERRQTKPGMEVIGRRQNTNGETVYKVRATEDDMTVKANAQVSKARRNTILSLIPADVKDECEAQCIGTLRDQDTKDPAESRKKLLDAFWVQGVTPAQIAELLGHPVEQVTPVELTTLRTYWTALKDGEATWVQIVEMHGGAKKAATQPAEPTKGNSGLKSALGKKPEPAPAKCAECGGVNGDHTGECSKFVDEPA